ncbi:hypothetical protein [Enterovirga rhinocerotis]|uniref:Cell envelope biogenesis protein TolA n=1 Tax=Enterovirga rhinocerotis TaxID=1339210 RepID=A0A4R7BN22_9HYPH|nr:hypothetical protein [Enterovirga rhinocerotis]TDR85317.1 hypothetical protein EV668_4872 [Enterovirga rhinocerotis]
MATKRKPQPKLKVFQATIGFYDTVVAVPSQAAALRAWGTSQNLFKDKTARPSEDEQATKAALSKPGAVLRRPIGTKAAFGIDAGLPEIPDLPPPTKKTTKKRKSPDRKALDQAEAELGRIEERGRTERAAFETRRQELDAEEAHAEERLRKAVDKARDRIARERQAFLDAGGKPKT